jgi:predicted glutamine amidotransferase
MCELLGVTSNVATNLAFSFSGFAMRGGKTGPHADGWGVSFYEGCFARTFLEPRPAYSSELREFLRQHPTPAALAIAHIRKMTRGRAAFENTHPFVRVFHGRHLVFAHNGTLPNVRKRALHAENRPIGETDSEHAFCVILEALRAAYPSGFPESPQELGRTLFELGNDLGSDGVFNFLLADGQHLFARCGDDLSYIVRRAPFGHATLVDADVRVNFADAMSDNPDESVAVVATEPLTKDEVWQKGLPGTLWAFGAGQLVTEILAPGARSAASALERAQTAS